MFSVVLNIMFQAPMGRFQLESKLKVPLFSGVIFFPFNLSPSLGCWPLEFKLDYCAYFINLFSSSTLPYFPIHHLGVNVPLISSNLVVFCAFFLWVVYLFQLLFLKYSLIHSFQTFKVLNINCNFKIHNFPFFTLKTHWPQRGLNPWIF